MAGPAPAPPEHVPSDRARLPRARRLLLALMLVTIGVPLPLTLATMSAPRSLQHALRSPALLGYVVDPPPIAPGIGAWWRGDFQRAVDGWFADKLEPRGWIIRATNQLYYTAFRRSYMYDRRIVIGRDEFLFEAAYLKSYCGPDPDRSELALLVAQVAELHRALVARGSALLFLVSASKAATLPEYLPAGLCRPPQPPERRAATLAGLLREAGVPVIDGASLTRAMKAEDPLPPFPRGGTHWSRLVAARLAAQAMAEFGRLAGADLGGLALGPIRWDAPPRGTDRDLADLLNLLVPPLDYPTGDAEVACRPTPDGRALRLVAVGGSFVELLLWQIADCDLFDRVELYSYVRGYRMRFPDHQREPIDREALDWSWLFDGRSLVLIELNEARIAERRAGVESFVEDARAGRE